MSETSKVPTPPPWPLPLRVGFRFVFTYLMLYLFNPTAETLLHSIPAYLGSGWALLKSLAVPWAAVVRWTGERMLGLSLPYEWTDTICCALLAFVVTMAWSGLDRRRLGYAGAHAFLRGAIRLHLVLSLLIYACVKAIPVQFGNLGPADWLVPFGEQSPSELLWRFMAASPGYTRLTGIVELIGVLLLLSPRTTLLGALVTAGALGNVIALNLWYRVGVLNASLHMFLMPLVLIVLDCGGGPSSFSAEASGLGARAVLVDPLYAFTGAEIRSRFEVTADNILSQVRATQDHWIWNFHRSPDELRSYRHAVLEAFLADYDQGVREHRYVVGNLPSLPFESGSFGLALCSHLLFLYSDLLTKDFHIRAVRELCRVAQEVRLFPLLTLNGDPSPHLGAVRSALAQEGWASEIVCVDYELQRGGNQMLKIDRL